ncbi:MAG TPA: ABC transporter ATP-binding protein, partial [Methanoregulaceae archaeon]|nr:ABC transporter ATP-binding protein [Methanoregulaceae archaeon]
MSDDIAIRVNGLGKRYRIAHETASYKTLGETITRAVKAPFRRLTGEAPARTTEEFWALKDVSFEVKRGEVVGIIGRNGAGKSTLLKILSRITTPTEGTVEVHGRIGSLLEVGTGFHPELSGRENIYLSGSILGMKRSEIDAKFDEIVKFAEMERFLDTPVKRYSSGMYVRLAFAVAAHLEPEILIVDEVLAVGDAKFQKKCLGKMSDVAREGRTVLFVSHNMSAVRSLCTKGLLLQDGRCSLFDSVDSVISRYLEEENSQVFEKIWNNDETAPSNASIRLSRVALCDDEGNVLDTIYTDTAITIVIDYFVINEGSSFGFWFNLTDKSNTNLFMSINNRETNWGRCDIDSGRYRTLCKIPPNLLNNGFFKITLNIMEGQYSHTLCLDEIFKFEVLDSPSIRGDYYGDFRGFFR